MGSVKWTRDSGDYGSCSPLRGKLHREPSSEVEKTVEPKRLNPGRGQAPYLVEVSVHLQMLSCNIVRW